MIYQASTSRYQEMQYRRCGRSGILLPAISLGLWHNFGGTDVFENGRAIIRRAFDAGITHFDLANNYGPPPGSAEENFGRIIKSDMRPYRDEMIISSKAGYYMWPGPYGEWGSRKYLVSSLDQSLKRMGLEYVDIFYSHRPDPNTPIEETMAALDHIVRSGKALYAGISNYSPEQTAKAAETLNALGTPCLIHQPKYSMFERAPEKQLLGTLEKKGIGCIAFSPLAQGLLTDRYLGGIPEDSRVAKGVGFLRKEHLTDERIAKAVALNKLAKKRGQSLAQMALAWVLREPVVSSVLIGASSVKQLDDNLQMMKNMNFLPEELSNIEKVLAG
jgi:L-glyceraldehyde 3-phosphate reductase